MEFRDPLFLSVPPNFICSLIDYLNSATVEQGLLNLVKVYKSPGTFENADCDSVCLGQGLRCCISNKLRKTSGFPLTGPFSLFPVLPQSPTFTLLYNLFCFILLIELFLVCLFAFMSLRCILICI